MADLKQKVLVISGPTGSGESTLTNLLIEKYPRFCRFITTTSRAPRTGEKNGRDYHFITKDEFEKKIRADKMLEYTHIKNRDQYYGTSKNEFNRISALGKIAILNVDIVGTRFFEKKYGAISIFVALESIDVLRQRLCRRDPQITDAELEKRLENARNELKNEQPFYKYTVVNKQNKLEEALEEIESILINEGYIES